MRSSRLFDWMRGTGGFNGGRAAMGKSHVVRFGSFRLDRRTRQLFDREARLETTPQLVEVLDYLIEHRHRTVGRDELLERFWPRAGTGGDAALNTCIRRIRALLGDDAEAPAYIRTQPRAGYRFIGTLARTRSPHRRRLALGGSVLASVLAAAAFASHGATFESEHTLSLVEVENLCEYELFPKFNAGLRESFLAQVQGRLPDDHVLLTGAGEANRQLRLSVRQTPERTVAVLTLLETQSGRMLWSDEFAAPTNSDDYVPLQRDLAARMTIGLVEALERHTG